MSRADKYQGMVPTKPRMDRALEELVELENELVAANAVIHDMERADDVVEKLQGRIKELSASPWISVETRLPEGPIMIFALNEYGEARAVNAVLLLEPGNTYTRWMPIPELPK